MREVGDYIYLVIIIIAALSSIFKKKKEKSLQLPVPERKTRNFEEILQEMLPMEEEPPVLQSVSKPIESTFEAQPILTYENTTDFSTLKAQKHVNRELTNNQIRENKKIVDEELADEIIKIEFCNPDDARKAFIYSEIFNKKY